MANQEQVEILKQGAKAWNEWRTARHVSVNDLTDAELSGANLSGAYLSIVNLERANLKGANLRNADLSGANLQYANLDGADLREAQLQGIHLSRAHIRNTDFSSASISFVNFGNIDFRNAMGLENVKHLEPSQVTTDTLKISQGKIPEVFLRGCGLSDWEIEEVKLYNPDLSNDEINKTLYKIYDLRATQALQISPFFISYNHADGMFINKLEGALNKKGIRFWRDIHDMKAGRIETQLDRAISQNRTVLLVLSGHSLKSDWVEHEVRKARDVEKELGRDVLCPIALDESWKSSPWPKRVMEQVMEYNILDFSTWEDNTKFKNTFNKLIDGLELFYK